MTGSIPRSGYSTLSVVRNSFAGVLRFVAEVHYPSRTQPERVQVHHEMDHESAIFNYRIHSSKFDHQSKVLTKRMCKELLMKGLILDDF